MGFGRLQVKLRLCLKNLLPDRDDGWSSITISDAVRRMSYDLCSGTAPRMGSRCVDCFHKRKISRINRFMVLCFA